MLRPGRYTRGKDPVPIVYGAGWAPGPVWAGAENLAPPQGIRKQGPMQTEACANPFRS